MSSLVKYIVSKTYKPFLVKYLSRTRTYWYKNITLQIPSEVFHPKFFFSTKSLLKYISHLPLAGRSFLELGAGSGLISIYAAKKDARVTATDINPVAVKALKINKTINEVDIEVIQSDMFESIPEQLFDVIAINPPYYKKDPKIFADHAWCCGKNGEYFQKLFQGLHKYVHSQTNILMVLSESCDIEMIKTFAFDKKFSFKSVHLTKSLLEKLSIYKIELAA